MAVIQTLSGSLAAQSSCQSGLSGPVSSPPVCGGSLEDCRGSTSADVTATSSAMGNGMGFPVPRGCPKSHQRCDDFLLSFWEQKYLRLAFWRKEELWVQALCQFVLAMGSNGCVGCFPFLAEGICPK